mgnify:CR=1 FL=1
MKINLTKPQYQVSTSDKRFRVLISGRRFGKTYLAITEMMKYASKPNQRIWLADDTVLTDASSPAAASTTSGAANWIGTGSHTIGNKTYNWTTGGMPANWNDDANFTPAERVFMIAFCNEAHSNYTPTDGSPFNFKSGNNNYNEPSQVYKNDWNDFRWWVFLMVI